MTIASNVLESIGNMPIVQLRKVVPPGSARVLVKLEWANPTRSMKDRMAKAVGCGSFRTTASSFRFNGLGGFSCLWNREIDEI